MHRRAFLATAGGAFAAPASLLIDTHIHLFSGNTARFPFHPRATYKPKPAPVEDYVAFARQVGITNAVIVHPEPYQDDHSYLEHCFAKEPRPNFFKGTCLLDAFRDDTPARLDQLTRRWPARIRALRFHRVTAEASTEGAIRERPLDSSEMRRTWRALADRGLIAQMHFIPMHAPQIGKLASEFREVKVVLDHMGRHNQGSDADWREVLNLAQYPNTVMKFSGLEYSPVKLAERTRQIYDAFGPERIVWGMMGMNRKEFDKSAKQFGDLFAFAPEAERKRIRGFNAYKLYGWA
jgi:predicted TIM-barrel fold metal-dependent hydrolase